MMTELFWSDSQPFRFEGQLRTETWFRSSLTDFDMYRDILFFKDPPLPTTPHPSSHQCAPTHTYTQMANCKD